MGYELKPGVTGNISSGGEYNNLDTVDSLQYSILSAEDAAAAALSATAAAASAASALTSANNADTSEANALASASSAASSASSASTSATNAATSASSASTSATNAAVSASSASTSATTATTQASIATAQASIATTKAAEASTSATSATTSATTATTQAGIATTKAAEASTSASNASTSETNAATSAASASTSANNAAFSELSSASSASAALTSANNSANSASAAATSANNAATSETNAANSASSASSSATNAASSATAAASSATAAAQSASDAVTTLASSLKKADNLSDLSNVPTARTNLGLGTAAVLNAGVANGVATLDAGGAVPLAQIPSSIKGGVSYQGTWNATTNTPTITSGVGSKGYYYVVSTAGSTNINGVTSWSIGDWIIFNGATWEKVDNTDAVTSVNGYTGTVALTYTDIGGASAAQGALAATAVQPNTTPTLTGVQFTGTTAGGGLATWNDTDGTLDITMKGGNVTLQVGQEQLVRVLNNTGSAFTDMQVIRITGASGNRLTAALAQANSESTSAASIAVVTEAIAANQQGFATVSGLVHDVNTSAFAEGAALWLSPTVAGGITTTKPTAPNHLVMIGWCVRSHATVGSIFVNVANGYELDELHDVLINGKATGDILYYDNSLTVWKNVPGLSLYDAVGTGIAMSIALG